MENIKELLKSGMKLIDIIVDYVNNQKTIINVEEFIKDEEVKEFLNISDKEIRNLLAPELANKGISSSISIESAFIYLVGSYVYYYLYNKTVTWFERRRFMKIDEIVDDRSLFMLHYLFKKTLNTRPNNRFNNLFELREYLKECILFFDLYKKE